MRLSPVVRALAALAVVAAGCSAGVQVAPQEQAAPTPAEAPALESEGEATPDATPTPVPLPPGRADLPDDLLLEPGARIAIETAEGQIFTVLGDGSNPVPLTNPDEGTRNGVPTWSADASRLGWVTTNDASGESFVRSARFDGSDWFEHPVESAPFYLSWDPTGAQVATLAPGDLGLELGVVSLPDAAYRAVDEGAPFWFSWNPDADGFLVHASGLRLDLVPIDGASQVLEPVPGAFQAPRWVDGPVELIYADQQDGQHFLVVAGPDGGGRRALVTYDGYLQFTVAPASGLIALQVIDPDRAPRADVITASLQDRDADIVDPIPRNELTVIATFGGDPFVLYPTVEDFTPSPVLAFYWSPDGNSLAWLLEINPGTGDCASETALYEWQFWTGSSITPGPRFVPTPTFACNYVPFFDQLDQSVSFWSPDAALFTYAGTDQLTGERGVWTIRPGTFEPPELTAEGEIGVWSSQNAGNAAQSAL